MVIDVRYSLSLSIQDGRTPLMEVSLTRHVDVVHVLIMARADINQRQKVMLSLWVEWS